MTRRCCRTCVHFVANPSDGINCWEGGPSEIEDPNRELSLEDCNAWEEIPSAQKRPVAYGVPFGRGRVLRLRG